MDADNEMLKMLFEQVNTNINILRNEYNIKIDGVNTNITENIKDIKEQIKSLDKNIDKIKNQYITKESCKESKKLILENHSVKRDEISLKKMTIITGSISAAIASIVGLLTKVITM